MSSPNKIAGVAAAAPNFSPEWIKANSRMLSFAGIAVVAGIALLWILGSSRQKRALNAEEAFGNAQQLMYTGKVEEGEAALTAAARRYAGTSAGTMAALRVAVNRLEARKYSDAISLLKEIQGKVNQRVFGASVHGLIGAAYADSGAFSLAADEYVKASRAAALKPDQEDYAYKAAEMYAQAGNKDRALDLLRPLAAGNNPTNVNTARAKKLTGELMVAPAKTGGAN